MSSLAGAPAREPNAQGNADADKNENLPRDEEPFEKSSDKLNRSRISAVPRGSTQMFEDWGDRVAAQLVFTREDAKVRTVGVRGMHGGNVVTSGGEPRRVGLSPR